MEDQLGDICDTKVIVPACDVSREPTTATIDCLPDSRHLSRQEKRIGGLPDPKELSRTEKRKYLKRLRRKVARQQAAEEEKAQKYAFLGIEAERLREDSDEEYDEDLLAKERAEHDEQEKLWLEREKKSMEDFKRQQDERSKLVSGEEDRMHDENEEDRFEEDGRADIIWNGNEITVRKWSVKGHLESTAFHDRKDETPSKLTPLPLQSVEFAGRNKRQQIPDFSEHDRMFGTEQDRTNCPFHIKTGVCRFGVRCSRVHVYSDQSFTLLMRNMYRGPGLRWENDEGLEHSDEEVAQHYEEFYEDVHSEFLPYGELVNFKTCKNGSSHLRGNVYVHYKTEVGAQEAYNAMNGRFYAGKQLTCEFVGVTRWRLALCGEYMKSHHRACSHGSACNFLHCFRNPHGEYDWADWDSPAPRYWKENMVKLFGYKTDLQEDDIERDESQRSGRYPTSPHPREHREHNESQRRRRHSTSPHSRDYRDEDKAQRFGRHSTSSHRREHRDKESRRRKQKHSSRSDGSDNLLRRTG